MDTREIRAKFWSGNVKQVTYLPVRGDHCSRHYITYVVEITALNKLRDNELKTIFRFEIAVSGIEHRVSC